MLRIQFAGQRVAVPTTPTQTLPELRAAAAAALGLPAARAAGLEFLAGFPPRPLALSPPDGPVSSAVGAGETLRAVEPAAGAASAAAAESASRASAAAPKAKPKAKAKSKRKAAARADLTDTAGVDYDDAADGDYNDDSDGEEAPKKKPKAKARAQAKPKPKPKPVGAGGVHTLASCGSSGKRKAAGAAAGPKKVTLSSKDGIGGNLAAAAAGGGGGEGTFWRAVLKKGMENATEAAQAQARVVAGLGGTYRFAVRAGGLAVTYPKGAGLRGDYTDLVDAFDRAQVVAVVKEVLAGGEREREMLRSDSMALASPRVFWNLVRHAGCDAETALPIVLPDLDWAWMASRRRVRSEKAVENARQAAADAAAEAAALLPPPPPGQAAAAAAAAAPAPPPDPADLRRRAAAAAAARAAGHDATAAAAAAETAAAAAVEAAAAAAADGLGDSALEAGDVGGSAAALAALAAASGAALLRDLAALDPEAVDAATGGGDGFAFVSAARDLMVTEAMEVLLDGCDPALPPALAALRIGTPRDLGLWAASADVLASMLGPDVPLPAGAGAQWAATVARMLARFPWLDDFATG